MIDDDIRANIDQRLDAIEAAHGVRILFAIESGSRAWGFASPDSDYDVRFVYAHDTDWYLSLEPGRDVIETPIEGVYDVNGWDIQKALKLLIKPNPVLLEWLVSPIVYRKAEPAFGKLGALAEAALTEMPVMYHYLHLGEGQWRRFLEGREQVALKKYFYALRPALALRWLRLHPGRRLPMDLPALLAGAELPAEAAVFLDDLRDRKQASKELGAGPRMPALDRLILDEFEQARAAAGRAPKPTPELVQQANALFREILAET